MTASRRNARTSCFKILLVPYDELNAILDRQHRRIGGKTPLDSFQKFRLVDHIDAILALTVPRLIDALTSSPKLDANASRDTAMDIGSEPHRQLASSMSQASVICSCFRPCTTEPTPRTFGRPSSVASCVKPSNAVVLWRLLAYLGWLCAAVVMFWALTNDRGFKIDSSSGYAFFTLAALWIIVLAKVLNRTTLPSSALSAAFVVSFGF